MKKICTLAFLCTLFFGLVTLDAKGQIGAKPLEALPTAYPWSDAQLLEPPVLAAEIKAGTAPIIFNIGAVEDIKGAKHIGPVSNALNMAKFKEQLSSLPKNTELVIYCGCCPFTKCPNIKPAFNELKNDGFTNIKVLNLSTNLKTNWIVKGFPFVAD